jgi:hypothetical protein
MANIVNEILGEHKGAIYSTELYVEKLENEEWFVRQSITQKVSDDLETWEECTVNFEAKDRLLEKAVADAAVLATLYLESINYDLFSADLELNEGEFLQ